MSIQKFLDAVKPHRQTPIRATATTWWWALILSLVLCLVVVLPARAQTATPEAPPGFVLVSSGEGVWLFRRDYPNGTPDYVQVVDLSQQARLKLLYANIIQPRPGRGVYGGDDPRFSLQPLDMFWDEAMLLDERTFCVSNGSFFYMPETPTRLAFPLRVDGKPITDGFGILTYPGQKLMLELWVDHADIHELSWENLHGSTAPDILGGLKEDANKRAKFAVGRTFIGLADNDHDRRYETVLILNTSTAVQSEVAETLREFNAQKVMMLDGGGSTQLMCQGESIISSDRLVPQAIAVYEGGPQSIAGSAPDGPMWLVAEQGQDIELDLALTNTGLETWRPVEHRIVYEDAEQRSHSSVELERSVEPGQELQIKVQVKGFANAGLHPLKLFWYIESEGRRTAGNPLDLRIAVLGDGQELQELEAQAQATITATVEVTGIATGTPRIIQVPPYLTASATVQAQPEDRLEARNLLWVPLLILPFALALLVVFVRRSSAGR